MTNFLFIIIGIFSFIGLVALIDYLVPVKRTNNLKEKDSKQGLAMVYGK